MNINFNTKMDTRTVFKYRFWFNENATKGRSPQNKVKN